MHHGIPRIAVAAWGGVFLVGGLVLPARGQGTTVQQPVVEQFSVGTTVVVPDGGEAYLGSVGYAADSSRDFGVFDPVGSNVGTERRHSGMSVGVTIHDFEAMDRALLGESPVRDTRPRTANATATTGLSRSSQAYWQLRDEWRSTPVMTAWPQGMAAAPRATATVAAAGDERFTGTPPRSAAAAASGASRDTDRGAIYLARAQQAERDGQRAVAESFYRLAELYGSSAGGGEHATPGAAARVMSAPPARTAGVLP